MVKPPLEPEFKPAIIELRNFFEDVKKYPNKQHLAISIERANGYIYRKEFDILPDGVDDERNTFIVERIIKCILWVVGGFKIYIAGSHVVYNNIKKYYSEGGLRDFDFHFMSTVFEKEMEVVECNFENIPQMKSSSLSVGGHLQGRRIGFDVGGSDIKVSAVKDEEVLSSEEIVWLPKLNEDINYHYDFFYKAMKGAVEKLGGDVDAIGISAAGVIVENKPKVSSIFIKVPKENFELVKGAYINVVKRLENELGHKIPFEVANDGDVTALAGALDLKDNCVLGIAMGTSEAVGYVDKNGNLPGWFSELAFMPVDFNKGAMIDEWSHDFGVGSDYLADSVGDGLLKHNRAYVKWLNEIMDKYPNLTIENCGSGGCRMDYELLKYCPIQSTSDQTNYRKYPYLAGNVLTACTPEQAAVWSYPLNDYEKIIPSDEVVVMNMCNAMLGRIHLASFINKLPDSQLDLIKEGINYYKSLVTFKKNAVPVYPKGASHFFDKDVAGGLKYKDKLLLVVWNTSGKPRTIRVNLKKYCVKNICVGYPTSIKTNYKFDKNTSILSVDFKEEYGGRVFEIKLSN